MLPHQRYNGFNEHLKDKFGHKVYRVSLNSGLTCPNIDGTVAKGGCYFCNDDYLLANSYHKQQSLDIQLQEGIDYIKERHPNTGKVLAYFQNGTNTHAPTEHLRKIFYEAIEHPEVMGLMISTRPDSLPESTLDLLSELNEKTYLWLEMGLQSPNDASLQKVNRAHTFEQYANACIELKKRNILNCSHIILGMPGETPEQMIEGVKPLNELPIDGIKIHNMFVTKFTALAKWYREGKYTPLTLDDYASLCVDYLERLRPDIIIHRLNAHGPRRLTVAPEWSINKLGTLNAIHNELEKRDSKQGLFYK